MPHSAIVLVDGPAVIDVKDRLSISLNLERVNLVHVDFHARHNVACQEVVGGSVERSLDGTIELIVVDWREAAVVDEVVLRRLRGEEARRVDEIVDCHWVADVGARRGWR